MQNSPKNITTHPATQSSTQEPNSTTFSYKLSKPRSKWLLPFIASLPQLAYLGTGFFTLGKMFSSCFLMDLNFSLLLL